MAQLKKSLIFVYIHIFLITFSSILAKRRLNDYMTMDQIKLFFELEEDDIIPDYELMHIKIPAIAKRSISQEMKVEFYISRKKITTTLKKISDPFLVASNTGIWTASTNTKSYNRVSYTPEPSIIKNLGDIVFYHDSLCGSAISMFPWHRTQRDSHYGIGIVCGNYTVKHVPSFNQSHGLNWTASTNRVFFRSVDAKHDEKETNFSAKMENQLYAVYEIRQKNFSDFNKVFNLKERNENVLRSVTRQAAYTPLRRPFYYTPPTIVYPKILITLHGDLYRTHDQRSLVYYLISYWNVIDMMFRKLSNPEVRLNLAGFIIPKDATAIPYVIEDKLNYPGISQYDTLVNLTNYFYKEEMRFDPDSYNILFIMTTKILCKTFRGRWVCGGTKGVSQVAHACTKDYIGGRSTGGSIVIDDFWEYSSVISGAHELGHSLGAGDHDGEGIAARCSDTAGNIMMPYASGNTNFMWSTCSQSAISIFLRSTPAWCLAQRPRIITQTREAMQGTYISIPGQCKNFNESSPGTCIKWNHVTDICQRLTCWTRAGCEDTYSLPYDGSDCTTSQGFHGYCYNQTCIRAYQ